MRPKENVADDLLVGLEIDAHFFVIGFHAVVFFAVPNVYPVLAEVITDRVDNFVVEIREQLAAAVDEVDFDLQPAKDRCVFATDHPRAVNGDVARRFFEIEDGIAVADARMGKIDIGRVIGPRPRRYNKSPRRIAFNPAVEQRDLKRVCIDKGRPAQDNIDLVALVIARAKVNLMPDEGRGAVEQVGKARRAVGIVVDQLLDIVAQGLARNRAPVRAVAAHAGEIVDNGNALALFDGFHRRTFAARPGANDEDVVVEGHISPLTILAPRIRVAPKNHPSARRFDRNLRHRRGHN